MSSDLKQYLTQSIPISTQLGLEIDQFTSTSLTIRAPLFPNRNDKGTAFAGSIYSAMVLSGWLFVSARLRQAGIDAQVVVVSADTGFDKPVDGDFLATCRLSDDQTWDRFTTKLAKRKNYKIQLPITAAVNGEVKARMDAVYVAWLPTIGASEV